MIYDAGTSCPFDEFEVYDQADPPVLQFLMWPVVVTDQTPLGRYTWQYNLHRMGAFYDILNYAHSVGISKAALMVGKLYRGFKECVPA